MILLFLACHDPSPADSKASTVEDSGGTPPGETSATVWVPVVGGCEAPSSLPSDPIVFTGEARTTQDEVNYLVEIVDVERFGDLTLAAGQGGLLVYNVAGVATPSLIGRGNGPGQGRFHRVEALDDRYVAATNREFGIYVFDLSDPTAPTEVWSESEVGAEGLSAVNGYLYVTTSDGIEVFDVSNPAVPLPAGEVAGLSAPWELSGAVSDTIYAADNLLGVVPIDISNPTETVIGTPVDVGTGVLHVRAHEGMLYASLGGAGVAVLDASNPAAPVEVARLETGGSVVMTELFQSCPLGWLPAKDHRCRIPHCGGRRSGCRRH